MEIIVSGPETGQGFHRELFPDSAIRLGRSPADGWAIPWDQRISREHADLRIADGELVVRCLEAARNPIVVGADKLREARFRDGDRFTIGRTTFEVVGRSTDEDSRDVLNERAYRHEELERYSFRDAAQQMELLGRLPVILESCATNEEVAARLVELLLEAIPNADAAAVAHFELPREGTAPDGTVASLADYSTLAQSVEKESSLDHLPFNLDKPTTMRVATRENYTGRFRPSRRLALSAILRNETVVHLWGGGETSVNFTVSEDLNWAFCVPIQGESNLGWVLYVSGAGDSSEEELGGDLRFAELLAQFLGSIRQVRSLEAKTTRLTQFFSPSLVKSLGSDDALEPREGDVGILFCDVRGFSRLSEQSRHDMTGLLHRISAALTLMTRAILRNEGAIADFQGDAALGFWGWPLASEEDPLRTCRAALQILRDFAMASGTPGGPLEGFRVGIGITHGRAVAGKIGTPEQSQITVLGHVVNLGARLEGLTKKFGVRVLVDGATSQAIRGRLSAAEGTTRKLAVVQPAGMETAVEVHELMPAELIGTTFTERHLADHQAAVEAFVEGRWPESFALLETLPDADRSRNLLMAHMAQHDYRAPDDWNGVLVFDTK